MNAKEAYQATIEGEVERIHSLIREATSKGMVEVVYHSSNFIKQEVIDWLKEEGYEIVNYVPRPMPRDFGVVDAPLTYGLGINWYGK